MVADLLAFAARVTVVVTACVAVRIGLRNLFFCGPCALRLSAGSSATRAMICV